MMNNWDSKAKAREALELEAESRLKARRIHDPRRKSSWMDPRWYDECKRYDTLLAQEIIALMRKQSGSHPEKPDNSYEKQKFKQDYVRQPYKD